MWTTSTGFPGDLDRPENDVEEPALDRGHGHGDLRLPAPDVRAHRRAALPVCGREIRQQTIDQIVDQVLALPERTKIQVLAPVVRGRKGEHQKNLRRPAKWLCPRARGWSDLRSFRDD